MKEDFTDFIEVSGLLNYDPDTISKIYKKNPKRLLKRLWQTLIPIFAYIFSVGWDKFCLLYTSPSPRDLLGSRMPSSA